jgi:hypothetical protein
MINTIENLANLIAVQGGAIVHASSCSDDEYSLALMQGKVGRNSQGHLFVYRGKIWLAQAESAIKARESVEQ